MYLRCDARPETPFPSGLPSSHCRRIGRGAFFSVLFCIEVYLISGTFSLLLLDDAGPNDQLKFDKTAGTITANKLCFGVEADDPAGKSFQSTLQAWAKPLNATEGVALLMINPDSKPHTFSVPIAKLPTPPGAEQWTIANGEEEEGDAHHAEEKSRKAMSVRDIWARKDLAPLAAGATDVTMTVGPMDSAFLRLY